MLVTTLTSVVPLPSTTALDVRFPDVFVTVPAPAGADQVPSPRQKVDDEAEVPLFRFVTGRLPVIPVLNGNPVQFVSSPLDGVPRTGVVRIGAVKVLFVNVLADDTVGTDIPSTARTPAEERVSVVSATLPSSIEPTPSAEVVDGVIPSIVSPTQLTKVPLAGVPRIGATNVGETLNTTAPVPVSSDMTPANCALDVAANCDNGLPVNASPPPLTVVNCNPSALALT